MKIATLQVRNFRCFKGPHTFGPFEATRVLIVGDNEGGKSSLLDAIQFALLGRCRGLDRGGRGVDVLLCVSAKPTDPLAVTLVLSGIKGYTHLSVTREWSAKSGGRFEVHDLARPDGTVVESFGGTSDEQYAAFLSLLGVTRDQLEASLNTDLLFLSDDTFVKNLILGVLNVQIPQDWDDDKVVRTISLAEADERYKQAYEERAMLKRSMKALGVPAKPESPRGSRTIAEIDAALTALEAEQRQKSEAKGKLLGAKDEQIARVRFLLTTATAELKAVPAASAQPCDDPQAEFDRLEANLTRLSAESETLTHTLNERLANQPKADSSFTEQLAAVEAHDPSRGCVLSRDFLPCPLKKPAITSALKLLRKQAQPAAEPNDTAELKDRLSRVVVTLNQVKASRDHIGKWILDEQSRQERLAAAHAAVRERESQLAALTADAPDAAATEALTALQGEIDALQARIDKGKSVRTLNVQLNRDWEAYEAASAKVKELEADLAKLEAAVKFYGPDGARVQALAGAVEGFTAAVSQRLSGFGYTVKFQAEPWEVFINDLPMRMLSTSARLRVGFVFQLAFADYLGTQFVLVDSLDWLLSQHRAALTQVVMSEPLAQVWLAKATEANAPVPNVEGTAVISLWAKE